MIKLRVDYREPHELEGVAGALRAQGMRVKVKIPKEQRGTYLRAYLTIFEHMFDKTEQKRYNDDDGLPPVEFQYPI